MAIPTKVERSLALKRIDGSIKILRETIDACNPEAISYVKHVTELIKSKRITGEISSWDYRIYNLLLNDAINDFIERCSCKCKL